MRTTVKTCFKCGAEKPLTEFYVHPAMGDGRLNKCKSCARADVRRNYEANADYYRQYDKLRANLPHRVAGRIAYAKSDAGKRSANLAKRRFIERNPEKRAAHIAVKNAIRDGRLNRQSCEVANDCKGRVEAHHDDYSKPLDVRWLCKKHHDQHHANERAA